MTNNIGGIGGYGYTIGNLYTGNQGKNLQETPDEVVQEENTQQPQVNVDPNDVLNFLAASSIKIATPASAGVTDPHLADRVDSYIQNFDMIYSVIAQEFGDQVANLLMDNDAFTEALIDLA